MIRAFSGRETGPRRTASKIVVDPVSCDAFGYCAELLPELVELDEWGYPIVSGEEVNEDLLRQAREAVRACPRRAFRIKTRD